MTREEAKKDCSTCKLIGTYSCHMVCGGSKSLYKPKQKIEPCDDAISREAVVQTIEDAKNAGELTFARTIKRIMELPSVTQKPGEWNTFELFQDGIKETWYECPKCKWSNALLIPRNYCPNCGAKMESEDSE